jgi:hypothetical protein
MQDWGDDLNAYLATLDARLTVVEDKPEYLFNSYSWQYSNAAPPPTGNQVRFDNANLSLAHSAVFRLLDNDGADRTQVFRMLSVGCQIRINDWDNVSAIHRFNVTGSATIGASDATVPISWISGTGTLPNAKANVAFIVILVI